MIITVSPSAAAAMPERSFLFSAVLTPMTIVLWNSSQSALPVSVYSLVTAFTGAQVSSAGRVALLPAIMFLIITLNMCWNLRYLLLLLLKTQELILIDELDRIIKNKNVCRDKVHHASPVREME
jgi:hypothetical protein